MEPQERYYNINKLNFIFALVSILLVTSVGLMFLSDSQRTWKDYQKEFQRLEIEKTRVKYDLESTKLAADKDYQALTADIQEAKKQYADKCSKIESSQKEITKLNTENEILDQRFRVIKAQLDAARYSYEEAITQNAASINNEKKNYDRLDAATADLKQKIADNTVAVAEKSKNLDDCGAQLKELEKKKRSLAKQEALLDRKLKKIDPKEMSMTNQVADLVRNLPVLDLANPSVKVQQIVLKDITEYINFQRVPKVDRCITCHLGIDNPDYKDLAQPFRTHPNLDLFVGKNSPHSLEEFGCTTCHGGRGRGTNFVSAAHTPTTAAQRKEWEKKYGWHEMTHWEEPMHPLPYTEAGCFKCHSNDTAIKGAERLNLGLNLIERAGCYNCHYIEKYKDWPKTGPDLTHIASKTSKDWTYRWIKDPKSFRHNTWMPSFFGESNTSDPESTKRSAQEIHAIVDYLFSKNEDFKLDKMPVWGSAEEGEKVVKSIGCLGCHSIAPEKSDKPRTRQTLLKEQGPNLIGFGTKTSKEWLYNWVKDPSRYHPDTRMPNLRLTDKEAADVAAFLAQSNNTAFAKTPIPPVDDATLNVVVGDILKKTLTDAQAAEKIKSMTQNDKLLFAGQKLIAQYGCYSCHIIPGFEKYKPIGTELTEEGSKAVERLDFGFLNIPKTRQAWFNQKMKDPRSFDKDRVRSADEKLRMPNYHFTDDEIQAIVTALLGFVKDKPETAKLAGQTPDKKAIQEGQKFIRQFNCQGCHIVEKEGGAIRPDMTDWLVKYDNRSPEEAQAMALSFSPPDLHGEGKKVQTKWLFEFLHQPETIRPWLKTHMPTYKFNVAHLNILVKYFSALDKEDFPFANVPTAPANAESIAAGKKLFSKDYFDCAKCHIVGDQMPAGSPDSWAPNFAMSKTRLKPEWIVEWIKNPPALLPSTKMPAFYDPGSFEQAGPPDILNGNSLKQIQALRDYLLTISDHGEEHAAEITQPVSPSPDVTQAAPTPAASTAPAEK